MHWLPSTRAPADSPPASSLSPHRSRLAAKWKPLRGIRVRGAQPPCRRRRAFGDAASERWRTRHPLPPAQPQPKAQTQEQTKRPTNPCCCRPCLSHASLAPFRFSRCGDRNFHWSTAGWTLCPGRASCPCQSRVGSPQRVFREALASVDEKVSCLPLAIDRVAHVQSLRRLADRLSMSLRDQKLALALQRHCLLIKPSAHPPTRLADSGSLDRRPQDRPAFLVRSVPRACWPGEPETIRAASPHPVSRAATTRLPRWRACLCRSDQ